MVCYIETASNISYYYLLSWKRRESRIMTWLCILALPLTLLQHSNCQLLRLWSFRRFSFRGRDRKGLCSYILVGIEIRYDRSKINICYGMIIRRSRWNICCYKVLEPNMRTHYWKHIYINVRHGIRSYQILGVL